MARTVIDSIGVVVELEDDPLLRDLQVADRTLEAFSRKSRSPVLVTAKLDTSSIQNSLDSLLPGTRQDVEIPVRLSGIDQAKTEAKELSASISPQAFEAFSQATTQSFGQIAQALNSLSGTLAQISGGVQGFFEGAAEGLTELGTGATRATQGVDRIVEGMSRAGDGTLAFEVGLRRIAEAQAESARSAETLASANGRLLEGMSTSGREAEAAAAGSRAWEQALRTLAVTQEQEAQAATAALARETQANRDLAESRRLAAVEAQRARLATATQAGAGPAVAALAVPTGFDKLAVDQQRVAAGSRDLAEGFALASRQALILREAEAALSTGSGRMAAGFAIAAEQARALAAAEDGVAIASGRAGAATTAHGLGAKQTALHFVTFAASTVGLDSAIARTAANVAIAGTAFTGIGTIITGISLAVIAGAEAWHLFNRSQEEAKEKADSNREALQRLRETQKGPVVTAQASFDTQRAEVERLSKALADLTVRQREAATIPAGRTGVPSLAAQNDLTKERVKLLKELADASSLLAAASQAVTDAERQEHGAELLRSLNQEVEAFGLGEIAARKLAVTLDDKLTDAQKKAATGALDHLGALQAQRRAMEESLQTTQRLAEAELKRLSAQSQAPLGQTFSLDVDTGGDGLRLLQAEIQDSVTLLDRMRKGMDQTSDAAKVLANQAAGFRALGERIGEAIKAADAAPLRLLAQAASDLSARLGLLKGGFGDAGTAQSEATQTAQRLGQAYAQLLTEIERQGGPLKASTDALRAASAAAEDLSRADVRGGALGVLAEQLAEARGKLQSFRAEAGEGFPDIRIALELEVTAAEQALANFLAKLKELQDQKIRIQLQVEVDTGFDKAAAGAKDLAKELEQMARVNPVFREMAARAKQFADALNDDRTQAEKLADAALSVGDAVASIADAFSFAGSALGVFGDDAQRELAAIADAAKDASALVASIATGNVLGAVSSGINLVGDLGKLFGGGPESEDDRLRRENNQRLAELNATITRQINGAGGLSDLGGITAQLAELAHIAGVTKGERLSSDDLEKALAKAGFSVEQFAQQIKQTTGIDILDSKGRVVAGAFDAATQAIEIMNEAARHFAEDIASQNRVRETEDRLGIGPRAGLDPDQQRLERARDAELEGLNLDPATEARIRALDLSTEEGRRAFLEFNKSLLILAESGGLTAEQLGKFKNVDELLGPINESADALDAFKKVTEQATLAQLQSRNALQARLFGDGELDASAQFQSQLQAAAALSPDISKQFAGLGTIGPEDQAAIRALLQKGFTDLIKGIIPEGLTAEEFQQFLEQGADFLDSFNKEVKDATKRLSDLNIPQGFRRAAIAFQVGDRGPDNGLQPTPPRTQTDEGGQAGGPLHPLQPLEAKPVPVSLDMRQVPLGGDGASLPDLTFVLGEQKDVLEDLLTFLAGGDATGSATRTPAPTPPSVSISIAPGAIVIHTQPGQDARETAQSVLNEFRRLAMQQTGDTLQLGSFS